MGFVSQIIGRSGRGRSNCPPGISVKFSQSGSATCYVAAKIRQKHRMIEVELDESSKRIRVKPSKDSGALMSGASGGAFSISKSFGRKVIAKGESRVFIPLTESADGWWYGKYGQ